MNGQYYYISTDGKTCGPHTTEELADMLRRGELGVNTQVAALGDESWRALGELLRACDMLPEMPVLGPCPKCGTELSGWQVPERCPHCCTILCTQSSSIIDNAILPLRRYAQLCGRSTRKEFWSFVLLSSVVGFVVGMLDSVLPGVSCLWSLALIVPMFCLGVRRMHDVGRSAKTVIWLYVLQVLMCVAAAVLLFYMIFNVDSIDPENLPMPFLISLVVTILLSLVYLGATVYYIVLCIFDSHRGTNKYGPSCKYPHG